MPLESHKIHTLKKYVGSSNESGVILPNIKKIAKSYNIKFNSISNNKEINKKLNQILKNDRPEIIEIKIDPKNTYIQN